MPAAHLATRFTGSLLGGMVGDMIGAAVEAESPAYVRKTFRNLDDILALKSVPEFLTGEWEVGHFTDDTQMTLALAEWLTTDEKLSGKTLLEHFCRMYEPWRHYGSGTRLILENFPHAQDRWMDLATAMFPQGSYGNGSAMRIAPVGLFLHNNLAAVLKAAHVSSLVTHAHYLAVQGSALQATAVALAVRGPVDTGNFLTMLANSLLHFQELGQDTTVYKKALARIVEGISKNVSPQKMSKLLGNGIKAEEAVPMAIYCYLSNQNSFEKAIESAIFLGGDTDTIASMTGAISGAALGEGSIPRRWIERATESVYTPARIREIALRLHEMGLSHGFTK
jgi:poly(ADP-ribose) glycohydrolase ARH3